MKEKILELLKDRHYRIEELDDILGFNVDELVYELIDENRIFQSKKGTLCLVNYKSGTLLMENKKYCVYVGNVKYLISKRDVCGAQPGDLVGLNVDNNTKEASVIKIIHHTDTISIGEVVLFKGILYVKDKASLIKINSNYPIGSIVSYKKGSKLEDRMFEGKVMEVMGHKDEPGTFLKALAKKYNIETEFKPEVLEEVKKIPQTVTEQDLVGRVDLRDEVTFTIDGDTSKDFDDAVSLFKLSNGNYLLKVHIADVSYYVKKDSTIDLCAKNRCTSNYPLNKVFPMLPFELSDGICSLNPNQDRLTRTYEMEIDSTGKVVNYRTYRSVINSNKRMTYNNVNKVYNNETVEDYDDYKTMLFNMLELAKILRRSRMNNHALNFEMPESVIVMSDDDKVSDVKLRNRGYAEKVIEEFMLLTGFSTAKYLKSKEVVFPCRVHDEMDIKKMYQMNETLSHMGVKKGAKDNSSKSISNLIDSISGSKNSDIFYVVILRSLAKANYSIRPGGHFALNYPIDTQVTSPIRRYIDLCIQRILNDLEMHKDMDRDFMKSYLDEICKLASIREVNGDFYERDIDDIAKCEYLEDKIGTNYQARITGNSQSGIRVTFYNGITGILDCGKYRFFENNYSFIIMDKTYRLGDTIDVEIESVDKVNNKILVKALTK